MICALRVSLSTIALVITGSPNISSQRSKDRFVAIIIDFLDALKEKLVKSSYAPSLSKEIYPSSSAITKSYFLNLCSK